MAHTNWIARATEDTRDQMEQWLDDFNADGEHEYTLEREYGHWVLAYEETSISFVRCSACDSVLLESADEFDECWECGERWEE